MPHSCYLLHCIFLSSLPWAVGQQLTSNPTLSWVYKQCHAQSEDMYNARCAHVFLSVQSSFTHWNTQHYLNSCILHHCSFNHSDTYSPATSSYDRILFWGYCFVCSLQIVIDKVLLLLSRPFERTIVLQKDSAGHVGFVFKNGKITQIAKDTSAAR